MGTRDLGNLSRHTNRDTYRSIRAGTNGRLLLTGSGLKKKKQKLWPASKTDHLCQS